MYSIVLTIHSWIRWITLILTIIAVVNAVRPAPAHGEPHGRGWDKYFMLAIDLQVLIGLLLYFGLSPFTMEAMNNMGLAMRTPALRFWAVEHAAGMFIVMALVRIGRILSASAPTPASARNRRLACFTLALIVMVASIPWPGMANGRPWVRM